MKGGKTSRAKSESHQLASRMKAWQEGGLGHDTYQINAMQEKIDNNIKAAYYAEQQRIQ